MHYFKTIIFLFILTFSSIISAQDVVITVTGKHYDMILELDTIKVFNYSNGTSLRLTELPAGITDYEINLTQSSYHSITTLQNNDERIELYSNELNKSVILVTVSEPSQIYIDVFEVSGKLLRSSEIECSIGENLIEVNTNCVSIIRVRTSHLIAGYKSVGIWNNNELSINRINALVTNRHTDTDNKKKSIKSNFSYQPGDSLKITVCKDTYHSNFVVKTPENLDHYIIYLSKPCSGAETLSDFDGNVYNTVQIGNQCWMKENLKTVHYADGTALIDGTGMTSDSHSKYWFDYDDNPENSEIYGKLYAWAAVMNGEGSSNTAPSGVQGVCPHGWHVPSKAEWITLANYLGGGLAGGKLKTPGYEYWNFPNTGADNKSGFSALPGGRLVFSDYVQVNQQCFFSVCTKDTSPLLFHLSTLNGNYSCGSDAGTQQQGFSVRCVKD